MAMHDFGVQLRNVVPPQLAVRMIEDEHFGDPEHARRFPQFVHANAPEVPVGPARDR